MRVSQRLDYTLRALVEIARAEDGRPLAAGEIASRLSLPKRFLEQQLTAMGRSGIVACRRGSGGGCVLARAAAEITVAEIVRAVQGDVLDVPHVQGSAVAAMWGRATDALERELASVTLEDLAEEQSASDERVSQMYYI